MVIVDIAGRSISSECGAEFDWPATRFQSYQYSAWISRWPVSVTEKLLALLPQKDKDKEVEI